MLTALLSVVIGTVGFIWSPDILSGLGAKAEVVRLGTGYMQVVFGGIFFLVSFFVLTRIFQGAGDTMTPSIWGW